MGRMKDYLMDVSYAIGDDGNLDTAKLRAATAMIDAERALWELLDHMTENDVPPEVWNAAVESIAKLRATGSELGAARYFYPMENFRPVPSDNMI